ncbi:hypothetical protein DPV78_003664 [Talaromyces pinophilus]|nr:hypothetical protein DPV78_003664 [Talaromyces pinophilus]
MVVLHPDLSSGPLLVCRSCWMPCSLVLSSLSAIICLFVDYLGSEAGVSTLLQSWATFGLQRPPTGIAGPGHMENLDDIALFRGKLRVFFGQAKIKLGNLSFGLNIHLHDRVHIYADQLVERDATIYIRETMPAWLLTEIHPPQDCEWLEGRLP